MSDELVNDHLANTEAQNDRVSQFAERIAKEYPDAYKLLQLKTGKLAEAVVRRGNNVDTSSDLSVEQRQQQDVLTNELTLFMLQVNEGNIHEAGTRAYHDVVVDGTVRKTADEVRQDAIETAVANNKALLQLGNPMNGGTGPVDLNSLLDESTEVLTALNRNQQTKLMTLPPTERGVRAVAASLSYLAHPIPAHPDILQQAFDKFGITTPAGNPVVAAQRMLHRSNLSSR